MHSNGGLKFIKSDNFLLVACPKLIVEEISKDYIHAAAFCILIISVV